MLAYLLLPLAALAQDPQLMEIRNRVPATFVAAGEAKSKYFEAPAKSDQTVIKKLADEWVSERATSKFKGRGFHYIGIFTGRPADELTPGRFAVYHLKFTDSPDIGKQIQKDMLFYAQGKELVWPSSRCSKFEPPPGQMMAVVRNKLK